MSFSVKPFPSPPVMRSRTPDAVPSLQSGDHLSLAEFRHRYEAQPHIKKAELIEGVVIVSSPVLHQQHGRPHAMLVGWLMFYLAATPYLDLSDNATLHLDKKNLEPDAQGVLRSQVFPGLWLNPAAFWSNDIPALFATLQAGVNTPDHAVLSTN